MTTSFERVFITLSSSVPFIGEHDKKHKTQLGKLFDEFIRIGSPLNLSGPTLEDLKFAHKKPFSIEKNFYFHKIGSATYESPPVTGETVVGVVKNFAQLLINETEQGHVICTSTSAKIFYRFYMTQEELELQIVK